MAYNIEQTDAQLLNTTAAIRYRLSFPHAAQHLVNVEMEIDTEAGELTLALPNWIPGSYKVRDFVSNQGDLQVFAPDGTQLTPEWTSKNRFTLAVPTAGTVRASWNWYGNERSVRLSHINRFHAFINPANVMMYVQGRTNELHHVEIHNPWSQISTPLSPVREGVWGALNYDILVDSPMELGDHFVATFTRHGATHEVAVIGAGDFDPDWIVEQCKIIVDTAVKMWGSLPYDRYVFINQLLSGLYGGLEHARCSVNIFDSEIFGDSDRAVKFLGLLCHEYFHLWNIKRIRPIEFGPFDYDREIYSSMLWLAEGCTSYYDDLMTYRCGFYNRAEYLRTLGSDHLSTLMAIPGRKAMSIKESSFLAWVKLYVPTPDQNNRQVSYYLKGGVIFMLLDLLIISESNGAKKLDDGMRALMARYEANPAVGLTEDEFIEIVGQATGVEIGTHLRHWLSSTDELPLAEYLGRFGLEWGSRVAVAEGQHFGESLPYQRPFPATWGGMQVEEIKTGLKVSRVVRDSPAERAGLGADDEVLALNGVRVGSSKQWDAVYRGALLAGKPLEIIAATEGRVYQATLQPEERVVWELTLKPEPTEEEARLMEFWLAR